MVDDSETKQPELIFWNLPTSLDSVSLSPLSLSLVLLLLLFLTSPFNLALSNCTGCCWIALSSLSSLLNFSLLSSPCIFISFLFLYVFWYSFPPPLPVLPIFPTQNNILSLSAQPPLTLTPSPGYVELTSTLWFICHCTPWPAHLNLSPLSLIRRPRSPPPMPPPEKTPAS